MSLPKLKVGDHVLVINDIDPDGYMQYGMVVQVDRLRGYDIWIELKSGPMTGQEHTWPRRHLRKLTPLELLALQSD